MAPTSEVTEFYGERKWVLRIRFHVTDSRPLTNRDLLSLAYVLDSITREATQQAVQRLQAPLAINREAAVELQNRLERVPAPALDTGELVDFSRGSWTITLDLADTALIAVLLWLLRTTVGHDVQAVWQDTKLSEKLRSMLTTDMPKVLEAAAYAVSHRLRRSWRLGARLRLEGTRVQVAPASREVRLEIEAGRGTVVAGDDKQGLWEG